MFVGMNKKLFYDAYLPNNWAALRNLMIYTNMLKNIKEEK